MTIVLKNNVVGYLAVAASAGDTVLRLRLNDGLKFPFLEPLQYFYATLTSATQGDAMEIVKVTYRMNDNLSVVRAQEDTTAIAFPVGAKVELRVTAKSIKDAIGEVDVTSNVEAAQAAAQAAAGSAASASTSATAAGSSAQAALTSETNAASSFQAASASAGQASTFANQASQSASNAAGSASAASISSGTAANSASSAAGSADSALGSANAASISAGNASTSATQSSQSASNAAGSASAAQISATTAASSAFNAAGSASGALGSANAASASASSASTSASQSSQSASNAAGSASAANISAIAAAASEFAASGSASGASSSASAASTSASQAATSASAAGASATASQGFATTAQGYRDDALIYRNDALGYRDAASSFADAANNSSVLADGYRAAAASSATLSANYAKQGGVAYTVSDFVADGLFWTTAFGGSPTTVADPPAAYTYTDVAAVGRVARVSLSAGDSYLQPKAVFQPVVGRKYRARVSAKVFSNATGGGTLTGAFYINGMNASFVHTDPSSDWTSAPDGSRVSIKSPFVEADGVVNFGIIYTCTAVSSNSAYWRIRFGMARSGGAGGVIEVREFLIEEITDIATTNATITTLQQTVSDGDQANATSITNLSASFGTGLAFGANACPDSNFDNIDAVWTNLYTQSGSLASKSVVTSAGKRFLRRQNTGMTVGHQSNLGVGYTYATPCSVGQRLELSAYVSFTNCSSASLMADWYDASGNYITSSTVVNGMTNNARSGGFVTAPVLAERVALNVIAYASAATNESQITEPYLRKVSSSQTALSPYERSVDPGTFAAITTEANARAAADSALTTTTTTLTARVAGSDLAINSNPTFTTYTNTTGVPDDWSTWEGGETGYRVAGIAPKVYAYRIAGTANLNRGLQQYVGGRVTQGWHVLEYDVTLNSGTFSGAGGHLNWGVDGLQGSVNMSFASDLDTTGAAPGNGVVGRLYKFRKLINVTTAGVNTSFIYAMAHWNGLGNIASANDITFHRVAIRPASQAEIEGRTALDLINTPGTGLQAQITNNATAIANETSARAAADTVLTARVDGADANGSLLKNPFFRIPFTSGTIPSGWYLWAATPPTIQHVAAPYGMAGNILYMTANAGANCGIAQTILGGISPGSKYKVGAQVARASGTLATAGIYIAWFTDAGVYISATNIPFVNTPRTDGTTGADPDRVVRYEKELTAPANAYRAEMILMNGWDGFGSVQAAGIYWFEAMFAPSTIAEAAIRTEAEARATADSANTSLITTLTARVNVNSNRFPHPQPLSTTLPSGWGGGIGVGNWEPLGGLFYYKARASGAAVTEWYYYDLEDSATAYIDTNQQYTLSATGYGGTGVSGDRTMMRIELFNSSGTLIHASPYVLLNSYGPRFSTTTSLTSGGEYVRRRVVFQREWAASGSYQDVVFNYIKLERGSVATAYTTEGSSNSLQAGVTTNASAIATVDGKLTASYGVTVDANGRIASMKLLSNGTTSSVKFTADTFQIFNGSTDVAPFEVTGGNVKIKSANVGTLNIGSGGITIQSGTSGARIVISNSVVEVYDATRLRVRMGIW